MTRSRLPLEALDIQTELLKFYTRTTLGVDVSNQILRLWFDALEEAGYVTRQSGYEGRNTVSDYVVQWGPVITGKSLCGPVYAVTEEILDMLESALSVMPDEKSYKRVLESDLPTTSGFIWFERPVIFIDKHDERMVTCGMSWCTFEFTNGKTLHVTLWTDPSDPRDDTYTSFHELRDRIEAPRNLIPCVGGEQILDSDQILPFIAEGKLRPMQFLLAFLRFIEETWVSTRQIEPGRPAIKRARRSGVPEPSVKIVHLRRIDHKARRNAEGELEEIEWQHRWIVRGHWRNQWYPSLQTHRPKYIPEYIKGPEGKPLIVHEKLFSVER